MNLLNESLGVSAEMVDDLLQRHVEAYFLALRDLGGEVSLSVPENMGNSVRAACRAEILNTISEGDVDEMKPAAINWIAVKLDDHIAGALIISPE